MILFEVFTSVVHGCSQALYRWLPPPFNLMDSLGSLDFRLREEIDPLRLNHDDWLDIIEVELGGHPNLAPWLVNVKKSKPELIETVVEQLIIHFKEVDEHGASYIVFGSESYPINLMHIPDPPLGVTILGNVKVLGKQMKAVVGSRKATRRAIQASYDLGHALARRGYVVVSGGAYGCDIAAHCGAIDYLNGQTVVIFAGGLGELHPKRNERIFREIEQNGGALVSERLWQSAARPHDFPVRNRIISGMSDEVFVMQANKNSGALVTARLGLEQGRDVKVFVSDSRASMDGCGIEMLIEEGATSFSGFQ